MDALLSAVWQALLQKPPAQLSQTERAVLAVLALEDARYESYWWFISGPHAQFAPFVVIALKMIGCPKAAAISADAVAVLGLPRQFDAETFEQAKQEFAGRADPFASLVAVCRRYDENDENIEEHLFAFIERHAEDTCIHVVSSNSNTFIIKRLNGNDNAAARPSAFGT